MWEISLFKRHVVQVLFIILFKFIRMYVYYNININIMTIIYEKYINLLN